MHTHLMHGQKRARNPLGRKGENSRDFATFISGTAVCRDVPAEVYGTLSQRLAITGLLVFKGLLHQNMKSPVSPLPTTDIYHKDKINSGACVCVRTCMCIYYPCKPLLTKGKLDRKQNIKTGKGRKKKRDPSHPRRSRSSASLQATEERKRVFREPSGVQSPEGTGLSELLLN